MNPTFISAIKKICSKRSGDRTISDIEALIQLTKNSKFFSSSNTFHKPCCYHLHYEFCEASQYVFLYGSTGNKFYIVLSGTVGVEVPVSNGNFEEVVQLNDGAGFGELALESEKPRQASIRCKTPCHFLYLDKKDYKECLGKVVKEKRNLFVEFLFSLPLFSAFTKGTLTKISYAFKEKVLKKSQILYKEGDLPEFFYVVGKGEIGFYKKLKASKGRFKRNSVNLDVNIANIGAGEMFGEEEILSGDYRLSSCKCTSEDALVYCISNNVNAYLGSSKTY